MSSFGVHQFKMWDVFVCVCVAQNWQDDPFFVETKKCRHDRCEADVKKVASLDLQSERCLSGAKKGRELMDVGETLGAVERYVI